MIPLRFNMFWTGVRGHGFMADQASDIKSIGFGVAIAFVAPGVVALWGAAQFSPTVARWFGATVRAPASGAGFLFVLLTSLAAGIFLSGLRHTLIVKLFERTGVRRAANLDESKMQAASTRAAIAQAVEDFFRYHQFYGNMSLAVCIAYVSYLTSRGMSPFKQPGTLVVVTVGVLALLASARDSLRRYYEVEAQVLSPEESIEDRAKPSVGRS
jgi:hypothetical protein